MDYKHYIEYHCKGDAGVEERIVAYICKRLKLSDFDSFRFIYYYTMTYNIPSALDMLYGERDKSKLSFRTDRRWVRIQDRFERLLQNLTPDKLRQLQNCKTTEQAYKAVSSWYYFGRYAAFLLLEIYYHVFKPNWVDNLKMPWDFNENFTKGAVIVCGSNNRQDLDRFLDNARRDTKDNCFSIETSLCAVEKIRKGTRWETYYTERLIENMQGTKYQTICYDFLHDDNGH